MYQYIQTRGNRSPHKVHAAVWLCACRNRLSGCFISSYPPPNYVVVNKLRHFHTIEIVDLLGRVIHFQHSNGNTITLDVSGYGNGIYFVRIITEDGANVEKFVKK